MSETEPYPEALIVLFDGVCNLCNGAVAFVIRNDPKRRFRFAALQSPVGQALLERHGLPTETLNSFVLIEGEHAFTKSTAALRAARRLGYLWPLAFVFILVPRPLRDFCYDLVARNRYRMFGKRESCMMPTPDLNARFLTSVEGVR
jgi:predicted DCC family thiol-disulfide oxidoreductase YuxK